VSPFQVACARGQIEVVRYLLDHGADHRMPNSEGLTPLQALGNPSGQSSRQSAGGLSRQRKVEALLQRANALPSHLPSLVAREQQLCLAALLHHRLRPSPSSNSRSAGIVTRPGARQEGGLLRDVAGIIAGALAPRARLDVLFRQVSTY
jgi:ankyrin repeat protein